MKWSEHLEQQREIGRGEGRIEGLIATLITTAIIKGTEYVLNETDFGDSIKEAWSNLWKEKKYEYKGFL